MADECGQNATIDKLLVNVNIDISVHRKLSSLANGSWGFVLGDCRNVLGADGSCSFNIIGAVAGKCSFLDFRPRDCRPSHFEENLNELLVCIPRGINILGIFYFDDGLKPKLMEFSLEELFPRIQTEILDLQQFEKWLFCKVNKEGQLDAELVELHGVLAEATNQHLLVNCKDDLMETWHSSKEWLRLKASVPCQIGLVDIQSSVLTEYQRVSTNLTEKGLTLISKQSNKILAPYKQAEKNAVDFLGSCKSSGSEMQEYSLLVRMTHKDEGTEVICPILMFECSAEDVLNLNLQLDVLVLVDKTLNCYALNQICVEALCIQAKNMLLSLARNKGKLGICESMVFHFKPNENCHFITVVYPSAKLNKVVVTDDELIDDRKKVHEMFMIPPNKPLFKKTQHFFNKPDGYHLINPHVGLKAGIKHGVCALVDGRYSYHHYMQDNFNDNGWGCAYRSLQTICSWFKLQGYTTTDVPNHIQIQEALVSIGDKPRNFIGSRQWIGSFEVGICLDKLLKVSSKILHVPCGAEMACKGRELIDHFREQGTPIMVGGGVLAHTILGVHFDESSGDIKFLILDPHFTGNEDLKTVQEKGWCGWKGPNFWDQTAHYNMYSR